MSKPMYSKYFNTSLRGASFEQEAFLIFNQMEEILDIQWDTRLPVQNFNDIKDTQIDLILHMKDKIILLEMKNAKSSLYAKNESDNSWYIVSEGKRTKIFSPIRQIILHDFAYKQNFPEENREIISYIVVPDMCKIQVPSTKVISLSKLINKIERREI